MGLIKKTAAEVSALVESRKEFILSSGWDDSIMYQYEVSFVSMEEALAGILNQEHVFDYTHEDTVYRLDQRVKEYGPATTFGGILDYEYPYLLTLMGGASAGTGIDHAELAEAKEEVLASIVHESIDAANLLAKKYLEEDLLGMPEVRRAFLRALVPVKFEAHD